MIHKEELADGAATYNLVAYSTPEAIPPKRFSNEISQSFRMPTVFVQRKCQGILRKPIVLENIMVLAAFSMVIREWSVTFPQQQNLNIPTSPFYFTKTKAPVSILETPVNLQQQLHCNFNLSRASTDTRHHASTATSSTQSPRKQGP